MSDAPAARHELTSRLLAEGLLIDTGVPGVFGRGAALEDVIRHLEARLDELGADGRPERVRFPSVLPRRVIQRTGYMETFPNLCGSIHAYEGDERGLPRLLSRVGAGEDWSPLLSQTSLVLAPAACYPLYPTLRGELPAGGRLFELTGQCFRHEPSDDPTRMQSFELREQVRVGSPQEVEAFRREWIARAPELFEGLGITVEVAVANDPFFGRGGRMLGAQQRAQELKFEMSALVVSGGPPTALASFNNHLDHFTAAFDIALPAGAPTHSACVGFGLDRIALALLSQHGLAPAAWPRSVRRWLWR